MVFLVGLGIAAIVAGGIAAIAGFGIGSVLTPMLAVAVDAKLAIAAVAIPHVIGTAQRFWMLRRHVDRRVLWSFGITSAIGGLAGALGHVRLSSRALSVVFGVLLLVAGLSQLSGLIERVQWGRGAAWVAGALSGALGGLVGNQGGIRTAAMLGFDVPKEAFVATATAIALFVDGARLPVYIATQAAALAGAWRFLIVATIGVVIGTAIGTRVLGTLPPGVFRRTVAALLIALGGYMLLRGGS